MITGHSTVSIKKYYWTVQQRNRVLFGTQLGVGPMVTNIFTSVNKVRRCTCSLVNTHTL